MERVGATEDHQQPFNTSNTSSSVTINVINSSQGVATSKSFSAITAGNSVVNDKEEDVVEGVSPSLHHPSPSSSLDSKDERSSSSSTTTTTTTTVAVPIPQPPPIYDDVNDVEDSNGDYSDDDADESLCGSNSNNNKSGSRRRGDGDEGGGEGCRGNTAPDGAGEYPSHPFINCCACGSANGNTITLYRRSRSHKSFPGVCMLGPDWPCLCLTYGLVLGPSLAFLVFVAPAVHIGVAIACILTMLCLLTALMLTSWSDPGYLRKQSPLQLERQKNEVFAKGERDEGPGGGSAALSRFTTCSRCNVLRPAGTHHCYDCEACVEELDHHCPWTGKCIGKSNLRYFYSFLWSLCIHVVVVTGVTFTWFITQAAGVK